MEDNSDYSELPYVKDYFTILPVNNMKVSLAKNFAPL